MITKTRLRRAAVVIAVTALAALGLAMAGAAYAEPGATSPYRVANTGGEPVNVRTAPSLGAPVIRILPEGTTINIVCQTTGSTVTGTVSDSSDIWDLLASGGYMSDLFASTAGIGVFTPGIPRCGGGGGGRIASELGGTWGGTVPVRGRAACTTPSGRAGSVTAPAGW